MTHRTLKSSKFWGLNSTVDKKILNPHWARPGTFTSDLILLSLLIQNRLTKQSYSIQILDAIKFVRCSMLASHWDLTKSNWFISSLWEEYNCKKKSLFHIVANFDLLLILLLDKEEQNQNDKYSNWSILVLAK